MLLPTLQPFRRRHGRERAGQAAPPAPPAPLTLVFASFDPGLLILRLGFDRAIDLSGLVPGQLFVNDHDTDTQYTGLGPGALIDPTTADIEMQFLQSTGFPDTRLVATSGSGIVAVDDGGTWPGTGGVDLLLPFP